MELLLARSSAAVALVILVVGTQPAGAQSSCAPVGIAASGSSTATDGPLSRPVSLYGREISLREALDRLSAAAKIRISYSAELLPLSKPVCLNYSQTAAGMVLDELLAGTSVAPVLVGDDQVVLSPFGNTSVQQIGRAGPQMLSSVGTLDRVVVTGSATGASQRGLPIALDVITGKELRARGSNTISTILDGAVPGVWIWEQSPLTMLARYGSIRGASSFGLSYPKVYIDGVEVANSLLVTHLNPDAIARVEVIRGPQGAALYGADAISGVISIVTRQEGTEAGAPRAQFTSQAGPVQSAYSTSTVYSQNHALSLRGGNGIRSSHANLSFSSVGPFIPNAYSRDVTATGGVRFVAAKSIVSGTARFFGEDARTPVSPLLAGIIASANAAANISADASAQRSQGLVSMEAAAIDSDDVQKVRQYTLGGVATFMPDDRWTHSITAGLDGYTLRTAAVLDGPFPTASDSALRAANGTAIRTTLRGSSVGQFGDLDGRASTVTLAIEHSLVRDRTNTSAGFAYDPNHTTPTPYSGSSDRSNLGLIGQANMSWNSKAYLSAGMRAEMNSDFTGIGTFAVLPMLGASYVVPVAGSSTVKFRGAYGKGIRPPSTIIRSGTLMGLQRSVVVPLGNEEQAGTEFGADIFAGGGLTLHITRFDQVASGLIQPVSVASSTSTAAPKNGTSTQQPRRITYQLQNVGEITNRGWEFESQIGLGPLSLAGTFANVRSRVRNLAARYTGDLRVGDRMLEVPTNTLGLTAALTQARWTMSWTASRASDWINYDRIALAAAFANSRHDIREFQGPQLRTYWRKYDAITQVKSSVSFVAPRGMTFSVVADNLLGQQQLGPDNISVTGGRTVGLRVQVLTR